MKREVEKDMNTAILESNNLFNSYLLSKGHDPSSYRMIMVVEYSVDGGKELTRRITVDFNPNDMIPPMRYRNEEHEVEILDEPKDCNCCGDGCETMPDEERQEILKRLADLGYL